MPESLDILAAVGGLKPRFRAFRLVLLVEAGTQRNCRCNDSVLTA